MGTLKAKTIEPATGSTLTLGASGDTVTVSSDSIKVNTFKDAGGNTLFTSDGAGTISSVNSGLAGTGPILISTATASGVSSISFTSGIDSTYDEYMFVLTDINPATDAAAKLSFQVNASGQSGYNEVMTTTMWYQQHSENDATAYTEYEQSLDQAQGTAFQALTREIGAETDECAAGILHLFNPASTTYVKHFYSRVNWYHSSNYSMEGFVAGYINVTAAITEIQFAPTTGNFDGVIQMYGIK